MANPNPSPETRWKPGQSGNPKGRPRAGLALAEAIRARGDEVITIGKGDEAIIATRLEHILRTLYERAQVGDTRATDIILDRLAGKPRQSIEISGDDERAPVRITTTARPNENENADEDPDAGD